MTEENKDKATDIHTPDDAENRYAFGSVTTSDKSEENDEGLNLSIEIPDTVSSSQEGNGNVTVNIGSININPEPTEEEYKVVGEFGVVTKDEYENVLAERQMEKDIESFAENLPEGLQSILGKITDTLQSVFSKIFAGVTSATALKSLESAKDNAIKHTTHAYTAEPAKKAALTTESTKTATTKFSERSDIPQPGTRVNQSSKTLGL